MVKKTGSYRPVEPVKPEIRSWPIRQAVCGEGVVPAGFPGKIGSTQKATRFWSNRGSANGNDTTSFCGEGKKKFGRSLKSTTLNHRPLRPSFAAAGDLPLLFERRPARRSSLLFSTGDQGPAILPPLLDRRGGDRRPALRFLCSRLLRLYSATTPPHASSSPAQEEHSDSRYGWTANTLPPSLNESQNWNEYGSKKETEQNNDKLGNGY
ncbi:unnamed protein product [Linum trigynum]|uniref:Uncharacterized protein n=1 Tax=Linum trigynum TaxID=586398 RepID=A0AAV2C9F2_9ROSI